MRGVVADENADGLLADLGSLFDSLGLAEHFAGRVGLFRLRDIGVALGATDREVWHVCQREGLVLLTGNRNHDGPESLEAVVRDSLAADSLPVLTPGRVGRTETEYTVAVAEGAAEVLYSLASGEPTFRGVGRVFLPLPRRV